MPEQQTSTAAAAAAATTASSLLAESSEQPTQQQKAPQSSNPFLNIFSNFLELFNLVPQMKKNRGDDSPAPEARKTTEVSPAADEVETEAKPTVVSFPRRKDESLVSLKLEPDEIEERNTNPVVLWQVYAIGSLLVLRWAWMRWNERRTRKKPSDEEPPPALD